MFTQSAPSAMVLATSKAEIIMPDAPIFIRLRSLAPTSEKYGEDIEDRGVIGLGAVWCADLQAKIMLSRFRRRQRMRNPFIARIIDIEFGAEWPLIELTLGALIDQRASVARRRPAFPEICPWRDPRCACAVIVDSFTMPDNQFNRMVSPLARMNFFFRLARATGGQSVTETWKEALERHQCHRIPADDDLAALKPDGINSLPGHVAGGDAEAVHHLHHRRFFARIGEARTLQDLTLDGARVDTGDGDAGVVQLRPE